MKSKDHSPKTVTQNSCKLCNPLGACLVFRGVRQSVPLLHGSQGCATYIRRYMISHFKEPIDIASSNFSENTAIFGGKGNLGTSLDNVISQYKPEIVGIASTCLSETIGEDVTMILKEYKAERNREGWVLPEIVYVSAPSYQGSHYDGFQAAITSLINHLSECREPGKHITLIPGMGSPADLRYLKEIMHDWGIDCIMMPDYSDTLDGTIWHDYEMIPAGGVSVEDIKRTGDSEASIEFCSFYDGPTGGSQLREKCGVNCYRSGYPIGLTKTDEFFSMLAEISDKEVPEKYKKERGRLVDSYVDSHKHMFGVRVLIYGEEDMAASLCSFVCETGMIPVVVGTGGDCSVFKQTISEITSEYGCEPIVAVNADFKELEDLAEEHRPDVIIGSSKGYAMSRRMGIPLIRVGFPIHDRVDGPRTMHFGYRGTQQLFDRIANAVIQTKQDKHAAGYTYM